MNYISIKLFFKKERKCQLGSDGTIVIFFLSHLYIISPYKCYSIFINSLKVIYTKPTFSENIFTLEIKSFPGKAGNINSKFAQTSWRIMEMFAFSIHTHQLKLLRQCLFSEHWKLPGEIEEFLLLRVMPKQYYAFDMKNEREWLMKL